MTIDVARYISGICFDKSAGPLPLSPAIKLSLQFRVFIDEVIIRSDGVNQIDIDT